DPEPASRVGARGRRFARRLQKGAKFPETLARILEVAAARKPLPSRMIWSANNAPSKPGNKRFPATERAAAMIGSAPPREASRDVAMDLPLARQVLANAERAVGEWQANVSRLLPAVRVEIAVAAAESEAETADQMED